ncbi:MAG: TetR/AcrR family transcriptional regulator [Nannocystaceae bacterium]
MPRPPATSRRATAERILDAAAEAFATYGPHAAKLADIAASVGIRRPSLLYHFPTKERLYAAVVDRAFRQLGDALSQAMSPADSFVERFDRVLATFVAFIDEHAELARILLRELLAADGPGRAIVADRVAPILDVVERFIRIDGRGVIRGGLAVRGALLQVASAIVLRAAAGELGEALWGPSDPTYALAHTLFFPDTSNPRPAQE